MFKIGEFSKITQVSIRMLRYYDEQGVLKPREIDPNSGYRLYGSDQIEELNRIIILRNMGFSVKEVKEILPSWNTSDMKRSLQQKITQIKKAIEDEKEQLTQIEGYLNDLNQQEKKLNIQVVIKKLPSYHVLSLRRVMKDYYHENELWMEMGKYVKNMEDIESNQCFSVYHDLDYREENVDIEVCVVCDKEEYVLNKKIKEIPDNLVYRQIEEVNTAASIIIKGPYSNISIAYKEFAYWLDKHKEYHMAGENRQICHVTMCHTNNPEDYITELIIPLERIK